MSLPVPNPTPLPVVAGSNFSGFPGLSILDVGATNGFLLEPPDQGLAVGQGLVLEAINLDIAAYSATTGQSLTGAVTLNTFFNLPPLYDFNTGMYGPFLSDPRCYFDHQTQRWFVTTLEIDLDPGTGVYSGRSHVLIAVTQTANLFGAFNIYSLDTTDDGTNGTVSHPNCPCFPDQPLIGADRFGFFISTNEFSTFGSAFNGANIYALSKLSLAAGANTNVVHFSGLSLAEGVAYSVQPATSPDFAGEPATGVEYLMSSLEFTGTLDNRIAVWAIDNTASLSSTHPAVTLQSKVIRSEVYGMPPPAMQPNLPGFTLYNNNGMLETLDSNDDRMQQVVYADGQLWAGLDTVVGPANNRRPGIAYFVVNPSFTGGVLDASMTSQGYVVAPGDSTIFPSIGVTSAGRAAMVMTLVGKQGTAMYPGGIFPSVAYTPFSLGTAPSTIFVAAAGQTPDDSYSADANGSARWGDYSAAVADGNRIWMAGEYIPGGPRYTGANWGTFILSVP